MKIIWHYYRPQRSCGQGNIFTPVCHSVHRGGGWFCLNACWDTTHPWTRQTSPRTRQTPPGIRLQHTVYERPVRILLECILVYFVFWHRSLSINWPADGFQGFVGIGCSAYCYVVVMFKDSSELAVLLIVMFNILWKPVVLVVILESNLYCKSFNFVFMSAKFIKRDNIIQLDLPSWQFFSYTPPPPANT